MNKVKLSAIIATGVVFALAAFLLLQPTPFAENFSFAQLVVIGCLHIVAAVLLLTSLKGFRRRFKQAYVWLGASFATLAVGMIQYPVIGALDAFDSPYVTSGAADIPFLFTSIFAYVGIVIIARTVNAKTILMSPWIAFGGAVAAGVLGAVLIKSPRTDLPPEALSFTLGVYIFEAVMVIFEVLILHKAIAAAGTIYKKALGWLLASELFVVVGGLGYVFSQAYIPFDHVYNYYSIGTIPYIFSSLLLIRAAVAFNQLAYAEQDLAKTAAPDKSQTSVDVITLVAQLASSPSEIDPFLDDLRLMTSELSENGKLNDKQQAKTAQIYKELEDFLVNKEPARKFSVEGLRELVEIRFKGSVSEPIFWRTIQA